MNDTKDAANEVCAAIYLVGAALTDNGFFVLLFAALGTGHILLRQIRNWAEK